MNVFNLKETMMSVQIMEMIGDMGERGTDSICSTTDILSTINTHDT